MEINKLVCWCCGTKLVDSSKLLNARNGNYATIYYPTGKMVCPYQCPPTREEAEKDKKGEETNAQEA